MGLLPFTVRLTMAILETNISRLTSHLGTFVRAGTYERCKISDSRYDLRYDTRWGRSVLPGIPMSMKPPAQL